MRIEEKIDKYLSEEQIKKTHIDSAIKYIEKKYPDANVNVVWYDGRKWYSFTYENGYNTDSQIETDFDELGYGDEEDYKQESDTKLAKTLRVKKAYILDL